MTTAKKTHNWCFTPNGDSRGYIQPGNLKELWFHTGTRCNLECAFCLEGSNPKNSRLGTPTLSEMKPYIDEALTMGVEKFSFTGGEPFLAKGIIDLLDYASQHKAVLVLSNGTEPLLRRFNKLCQLRNNPHPVSLRISLDDLNPKNHDAHRGAGKFAKAVEALKMLHQEGFHVSVARHMKKSENTEEVDQGFREFFVSNGLPEDLHIVAFPDFLTPSASAEVPQITEDCMTRYHTVESRANFMCHYSKMVVKRDGELRVYACTLVDDDSDYELNQNLKQSQNQRISMKHHRCYSCFAYGSSCSE